MDKHPEKQYLQLIREIMNHGVLEETRNGITKSIFGYFMKFPLNNGELWSL
jgi:thymidylate synthase